MILPPPDVGLTAAKFFDSSSTTILAVAGLLSRGLPAFARDSRFLRTLVPAAAELDRFLNSSCCLIVLSSLLGVERNFISDRSGIFESSC